jgi:Na+/H+ antiporter NhaD/arsenite permease-like protein
MLITNDAVCVLGAPLLVRLIGRHRLPALPFLLALATGSNTGSVATLVGNPQNMLCASLGGLGYREHLALMLPVAIAGLAVNHAILALGFRRVLDIPPLSAPGAPPPETPESGRLSLIVIAVVTAAYLAGADLAWASLAGFAVLLVVHQRDARDVFRHIDWSVLIFFAGLLAMASTFAGNLTLLGSVANVIVAESARDLGGIGYLRYLAVGLPVAILTTAMGTVWMYWVWP